MNRETSVYLDLVRLTAALVVMVYHLSSPDWTGGLGWQLWPFGNPAVDVFFVLSGFVIAYAVAAKERDLKTYVLNRTARIYSVAIPALLLTAALSFIGHMFRPDFPWGDTSVLTYLRSLLFVNEIWFVSVVPGNDGPYWSLGYEVWYYIIFGAAMFAKGWLRFALAGIFLAIAGPRIAEMFPLWLVGYGAYWLTQHRAMSKPLALALWLGSTLALGALAVWQYRHAMTCGYGCWLSPIFSRPLDDWREYGIDYGIGVLIAINFVGFYFSASIWSALIKLVQRPVQWLAGATFTIYLMHDPVAQFLTLLSPWDLGSRPQGAFIYLGTLAIVFALAEVTERKKHQWRAALQWVINPRHDLWVNVARHQR